MIDAKHLRIGNWVSVYGRHYQVLALHDDLVYTKGAGANEPVFVEPIDISPELLVQCGFEKNAYGVYAHVSGLSFHENKECFALSGLMFGIQRINGPYKYVHQLQNLVFALTGTELIINPPPEN